MAAHYNHYAQLFDEAMKLWEQNHEEYLTLISKYESLMEKKRQNNKEKGTKNIDLRVICGYKRDYPHVEFLEVATEEDAEKYLLELTESELKDTIFDVKFNFVDHPLCETLRSWIIDAKILLRRAKYKISPLSMSPEACKSGGRRRSTRKTPSGFDDR